MSTANGVSAKPSQPKSAQRFRREHSVDLFFEFSTLGLVLCGYLAMLSTGQLDLPTSIVVCVALLYRAISLYGFLPQRFPGWLLGSLTLLAIGAYPLDFLWWSGDFIQATVHLIFLLALLKLLSAQGNRDHIALLVLSFLLIVVAAILTSDSLFFLFLLGFLTFSVMSFTSMELRRSLEVHKVIASSSRRLPMRLTFVSLLISGGILAMSLGLFYALPRTAKAALNQFLIQRTASSGFAKEVVLGSFSELVRNPAVVMRIREIAGDSRQQPPAFPTHWRGATLSEFDGRRWSSPVQTGELSRIRNNEIFLASADQRRRPGLRGGYEVHLAAELAEQLFIPGLAEFVRLDQPFVLRYPDRSIRLSSPPNEELRYAVFSYFDGEAELAEGRVASLSATELGAIRGVELLRLPPLDPRIEEMARTITEAYDNPLDKARILSSYLRGNYRYSLDASTSERPDPLAAFLFESREGHCEYFASALAVMLRSIGIPSRLATGFLANEYNPLTGWHVVRMSDAHSWVEVWLPDRGWYAFDPTPSARVQPMSQIFARFRLWQDAIDTFWNDWVLSYDLSRQLSLAERLESYGARLREFYEFVLAGLTGWKERIADGRIPAAAAVTALAFILIWQWRKRYPRGRGPSYDPSIGDDEATRVYSRVLRGLSKRGYSKPRWQTSAEFARSLAAFNALSWMQEFTHAYQRARYGGDTIALDRMKALAEELPHVPRR